MGNIDFCTVLFEIRVLESAITQTAMSVSVTLAQLKRDEARLARLAVMARASSSKLEVIHARRRRCSCPAWLRGAA